MPSDDSANIQTLDTPTRIRAMEVKRICRDVAGADIFIYCGERTLAEQAKLFRQSRTTAEIRSRQQSLRDRGFDFLADIIDSVGVQDGTIGQHVTKAGPGESWHQYKSAFDSVPRVGGQLMWNKDHPHWEVYSSAAELVGLTWAGNWKTFVEYPHCQLHTASNPINYYKTPSVVLEALGI